MQIKDKTLILHEWESVALSKEAYENLTSSPFPYDHQISVFSNWGKRYLKASSYIGVCKLQTSFTVERKECNQIIILPKICNRNDDGNTENWADFFSMFEIAHNVKIPDFIKKTDLSSCDNLAVLFALIYVLMVEELLLRIRRSYAIRTEQLHSRMRGKLLVGAYVRESLAHCRPQDPVCQFYELTGDTPLNRIIKAGLHIAKQLIHDFDHGHAYHDGQSISGKVNKCLSAFHAVADERINPSDFARLHFHSQNRHYEQPIILAKLLLLNSRPDLAGGETGVHGFFLDMNALFERFVVGLLKRAHTCEIDYQGEKKFGHKIQHGDRTYSKLKPDIMLCVGSGEGLTIIDVKYKEAFEQLSMSENDVSISMNEELDGQHIRFSYTDIYQVVAYLDNYSAHKPCRAIIAYPSMTERIVIHRNTLEGFAGKAIHFMSVGLLNLNARLAIIDKNTISDFPCGSCSKHT